MTTHRPGLAAAHATGAAFHRATGLPDCIGRPTLLLPDDPTGHTDPPAGGGDGPKPSPPREPAEAPKYTDAQVNAWAARDRDQGRRAALNEVSTTLGCTVEEAADILKAHRESEDAKLTAAQKAEQAANEAKKQAEDDRTAAARERHEAKVERALLGAGVPEEKLPRALRALDDIEVGADKDAITTAVKALKDDVPGLFGATAPVPGSDPGTPPTGGQRPTGNAFGAGGAAEAERRFGKQTTPA